MLKSFHVSERSCVWVEAEAELAPFPRIHSAAGHVRALCAAPDRSLLPAAPLMCAFHVLRRTLYFSPRSAAAAAEGEEEEEGGLSCASSPAGGAQSAAEAALRPAGAEREGAGRWRLRRGETPDREGAPARAPPLHLSGDEKFDENGTDEEDDDEGARARACEHRKCWEIHKVVGRCWLRPPPPHPLRVRSLRVREGERGRERSASAVVWT